MDAVAFHGGHVTPLHCAIVKWQVEAVAHLLHAGANPNVTDKNGSTPLVYAMQQGHQEIAKLVLSAGADVNYKNPFNGNTALISSVDVPKNLEMIKFLVYHGAHLDEINSKGETVLFKAVENNEKDVVSFLVGSGADVNVKTFQGWTPLGMALNVANIHDMSIIVYQLLQGGAHVNDDLTSKKITPLHLASVIDSADTSILEALVRLGAHLDALDADGQTVFQWAARAHCPRAMQMLVDFGYPVWKETWIFNQQDEPHMGGGSSGFGPWLQDVVYMPPSLINLARYQVRRCIHRSFFQDFQKNFATVLVSLQQTAEDASESVSSTAASSTSWSRQDQCASWNASTKRSNTDPWQFLPRKIKDYIFFL